MCQTYGLHPREAAKTYTSPLMHVLYDAHFWANFVPPAESKDKPKDGTKMGADELNRLFGGA